MMATYKGPMAAGVIRVESGSEIPFERGQEIELPDTVKLNADQWEISAPVKIEIKQPTINEV